MLNGSVNKIEFDEWRMNEIERKRKMAKADEIELEKWKEHKPNRIWNETYILLVYAMAIITTTTTIASLLPSLTHSAGRTLAKSPLVYSLHKLESIRSFP